MNTISAPPPYDAGAEAARMRGVSAAHWYVLPDGGRAPDRIRLGRRVGWRVAERSAWVAAGAPPAQHWAAVRPGGDHGR